jgi:hypothetical protein
MIPAAARAVLPQSGPRPKIAPAAPPGLPTSTERSSLENELLERLKAGIYSQEANDRPQKVFASPFRFGILTNESFPAPSEPSHII